MKQMEKTGKPFRARLEKALPVIYALFVFFLYFSLLSDAYFTDEEDVFFGAYNVIKGQDVYKAFLSQHMPFSYYIIALVALCGARTVFQFRLGTYVLLTVLWEGIYLRHRKRLHPAALFAMPLIYLTVLKTFLMGTTMISDHWQGIGLVVILLEVVRYADTREISLPCAWMVCLGIVLSFGTTFASAYSVLCYFLAVVALQWKAIRRDRREGDPFGRLKEGKYLREDLRLVGICLAPFALLLIWYLLSGNVANFWSGAYEIVTQVYIKYTGGFGSDPVRVVWETVGNYGKYLWKVTRSLPKDPLTALKYLIPALGMVGFAVRMAWKAKSPTVGVMIVLAAVYGGMRGFDGFHGMAYHAQAAAGLALLLGEGLQAADSRVIRARAAAPASASRSALTLRIFALRIALAAVGAALLADFVVWAGYNLLYPQILRNRTTRCEVRILDLLTDPGEVVFPCNQPVNSLDVMDLELVPKEACGAISYPYFYQVWGDRQMTSIRERPHVVMYNPDESIWGEVFREYAPDFDAFMREHYTRLPQAEEIWVSNEFLPEASRRLSEAGYGDLVSSNVVAITANQPVKYHTGDRVQGLFTAEAARLSAVRICASCYHRRSFPTLLLELRDPETGDLVTEARLDGTDIADTFFSRCPMRAELEPGKEYRLDITVLEIGGKGDMEFYFTPEGDLALAAEYDLNP